MMVQEHGDTRGAVADPCVTRHIARGAHGLRRGVATAVDSSSVNFPPAQWFSDKGWPWPVLVDESTGAGAAGKAAAAYGATGWPYFVIVGADGKVMVRGEDVLLRAKGTQRIRAGNVKKGDPLQTARLAGIMAAKRTSDLVPLCHPVPWCLWTR